mgnify:CR=1 FL=1
MTADEIVKGLGGEGSRAVCPSCQSRAHAEDNPSLSIETSPSGKVLLHCFWGCPQKDVLAALCARGLWGASRSQKGINSQREIANQRELARIVRWASSIVAMAEFETALGNSVTDPHDKAALQKAQGIVAAYPDWRGVDSLRDLDNQVIPFYFLDELVEAEAAREGGELC